MSLRSELNHAVDFDKVLEQISAFASFSCSKNEILNASCLSSRLEINDRLQEVKEAMELIRKEIKVNTAGLSDISSSVKKAEKQMVCTPRELLDIMMFLYAIRNIKQSLLESDTERLKDHASSLEYCSALLKKIQEQIDMSGSIKEDATPLLKKKNKELIDMRLMLSTKAKAFVKKHASSLMENMTTLVSNRVSVLVKAQDKNIFHGMIHGSSQSGLAYYVEPQEFIELNNAIQTITLEIDEEKRRICKELSILVSKNKVQLYSNLETATIIDCALAKAMWAIRYDGCVPMLQTRDHMLRFEQARHPLIDEKRVVANTYACDANQYCLMISGPNMGGKTVTLKTIGLFVALSHCGFPVLCHQAILPYYSSLFFDIGDNQSIENNLSTFSSHISNISKICSQCDAHSFVLLDEVGNGTDPLEGASLATAILEYLIQKGCTIITSTHYSQVKAFGKTNPHVLVSSVEFDQETLKPTYRYIPGISGASYAFDIAREYDLDSSILEKASQYKSDNEQNIEKELNRLEKLQNQVLKEKERFEHLIQDAHRIQKEAAETQKEINKKKEALDREYEERLQVMLEQKQEEAEELIQELKKKNTSKMHEQIEVKHKINLLGPEKEKDELQSEDFKVGDYVRIKDLNSHGEILDLRKKEATILTNGMKMKIKVNRLQKMPKPKIQTVSSKRVERVFKRFPLELNIIGMRVEEGLREVDKYIDQAVSHNVKQVRIIHGMGTGKLRTAVWKDLEKHPQVKSKMSGGPSEGGLGATIVLLK